jgi:hypothetical protein
MNESGYTAPKSKKIRWTISYRGTFPNKVMPKRHITLATRSGFARPSGTCCAGRVATDVKRHATPRGLGVMRETTLADE